MLVVARLTMAEKERPREDRAKLRNHCLTALRMRGGSHLAQHHVGLARKDARCVCFVVMQLSISSLPRFRVRGAEFRANIGTHDVFFFHFLFFFLCRPTFGFVDK